MAPGQWKGKGRALPRDEGPGGSAGVVVPLKMVGSGIYDVAYTIPITVGKDDQQFNLQVDTGSSDLWIASTSCSTSTCGSSGRLFDPSAARQTGANFSISYLQGAVSGPIVWDEVEVGGYSIENQALAAADSVSSEPLSSSFDGILGIALPLNSVIAGAIPPVTDNAPDGAAWASNLFSITPDEQAPSARFLSLSLERPGSNRVPSLLGIGRHPTEVVTNTSNILYWTLMSESAGTLFWKVGVRAITVYVNGTAKPVDVGRSNTGAVFPSAVLDSGVPLILTTSKLANAIYGALGIGPASDGQYYVPCNVPLNMTITLDERPEIPLHPLDLTAEPPQDNNAQFCVGLIQSADPALASPDSGIGDIILGVPFLRNTYTVMAYSIPNADGSFNTSNATINDGGASQPVRPRLGLMSLTDPTVALQEFNTVRVLNMPLTNGTSVGGDSTMPSNVNSKKLSVGIIVLFGLLGFFALCCFMFGIRWLILRRKYRKTAEASPLGGYGGDDKMDLSAFQQALRNAAREQEPSVEALRQMQSGSYKREKVMSSSTTSSGQTRVGDVVIDGLKKEPVQDHVHEFGYFPRVVGEHDEHSLGDRVAEEQMLIMGDTLIDNAGWRESLSGPDLDRDVESSPERPYHQRTQTEQDAREQQHTWQRSLSTPLLGGGDIPGEFGEAGDVGMVGIGTALRTSKIDASFRDSVISSGSSSPVTPRGRSSWSPDPQRTSTGSVSQDAPGHPIVL